MWKHKSERKTLPAPIPIVSLQQWKVMWCSVVVDYLLLWLTSCMFRDAFLHTVLVKSGYLNPRLGLPASLDRSGQISSFLYVKQPIRHQQGVGDCLLKYLQTKVKVWRLGTVWSEDTSLLTFFPKYKFKCISGNKAMRTSPALSGQSHVLVIPVVKHSK